MITRVPACCAAILVGCALMPTQVVQYHASPARVQAEASKLKPALWQIPLGTDLVDELHLFVFPLTLGAGQRLFADGGNTAKFTLAHANAYDSGVVHLAYRSTE